METKTEQNTISDEIEIDLKEILHALLSKLWLILLLGVLLGLGMLVYSKYVIDPVYSSTTKVYVLNRQNTDSNVTYTDLQTGSQLTKDYTELVKSRTVLSKVLENLELDMGVEELAGMIGVSTPEDTRIVTITVNSTDVYQAQRIADEVREVASKHICKVMNLEAVNTVDEANLPTAPSGPDVKRNTVFGFGAGVLLGIALVVVLHLLNDSIRTPDDVERLLGVGVLASIPIMENESKRHKRRKIPELPVDDFADEEDSDMYRPDKEANL